MAPPVNTDRLRKRQQAIDRFQQNADCEILISTTSAGNTLTAAKQVFLLELP